MNPQRIAEYFRRAGERGDAQKLSRAPHFGKLATNAAMQGLMGKTETELLESMNSALEALGTPVPDYPPEPSNE